MENECEALPGVAYPGVRDNRSTINTKTGYDDDDDSLAFSIKRWFATCAVYRNICLMSVVLLDRETIQMFFCAVKDIA